MYLIEDFIEQSLNMKNTSDGGSVAYHFSDLVLVKYTRSIKYGKARENEELVAEKANEKNAKGVRTPAHLAIKRVIDGENEICWVLQERAKGRIFHDYCSNDDNKVQLEMQSRLAEAPDKHYEKFISDVCELFNLGLELKSKNIFYDESLEDGGFTIIDLLKYSEIPFDPNSIKDVLYLCGMTQGIYNCSRVNPYDKKATEEDKKIDNEQYFQIRKKMFLAMERVIPNFEQHRRWVLRSMHQDLLEYFNQNGIEVGDLKLDDSEYIQFNQTAKAILDSSIEKIKSGKNEYWQIGANEIRIALDNWGMQDAWRYHKSNTKDRNSFNGEDSEYEYKNACAEDLERMLNDVFDDQLDLLSNNITNPYILKAKEDLDKRRPTGDEKPRSL